MDPQFVETANYTSKMAFVTYLSLCSAQLAALRARAKAESRLLLEVL